MVSEECIREKFSYEKLSQEQNQKQQAMRNKQKIEDLKE